MIDDIRKHPIHYAGLLMILTLGLLLLLAGYRDGRQTLAALCFLGTGYLGWGVYHHRHLHDLTVKIVLEYGLVAALAGLILWGVLSRT